MDTTESVATLARLGIRAQPSAVPTAGANPIPAPVPAPGNRVSTYDQFKAQVDESLAFPVVGDPLSTVTDRNGRINAFSRSTIIVPAGKSFVQSIEGDYIYVSTSALADSTVVDAVVSPDSQTNAATYIKPKASVVFPKPFRNVQFSNPYGQDLTVNCYVGFGRYWDNALSSITNYGQLSSVATQQIARAANPYAAGQVVGSAMTFSGFSNALNGLGFITAATLAKSNTTVANANFRLYLYNTATAMAADGAAFNTSFANFFTVTGNRTNFCGMVDFPAFTADGSAGFSICTVSGIKVPFFTASADNKLYGILVAQAAYAAAAETLSVNLQYTHDTRY
jgi:hypothetical protein